MIGLDSTILKGETEVCARTEVQILECIRNDSFVKITSYIREQTVPYGVLLDKVG